MANKETEYEYDPIKEQVGGKEAERVVWSTKAINTAVDGIRKGLPLKANPFIGKNTNLLKPDLVYKRTAEEIEDYIKCMNDPIYFASKCFLMTPEGLQPCILRDYQIDYLHHLQNNRFSIFLSCRQSGKTLNMLTKVNILINFNTKNIKDISYMLKRYYFYIDKDNNYIVELPLFELIRLYDNSLISKLRYWLYKFIYQIENGRKKRSENIKET